MTTLSPITRTKATASDAGTLAAPLHSLPDDGNKYELVRGEPAKADEVTAEQLTWAPPGTNESLVVDVQAVFGDRVSVS